MLVGKIVYLIQDVYKLFRTGKATINPMRWDEPEKSVPLEPLNDSRRIVMERKRTIFHLNMRMKAPVSS